jgi:sterol desaturase/sphingolipid hydroxylase (fatty acid hydroxylase superfamily)
MNATADAAFAAAPAAFSWSRTAVDLMLLPRWWSSPSALVALTFATVAALELLSYTVPLVLERVSEDDGLKVIAPGGRFLHRLITRDYVYIWWNKFVTAGFVLHYAQWLLHGGPAHVVVDYTFASMTWVNMLAPIPLSFVVYDLMYAPFHRLLHWQPIYPYIHKHHHRHLAPMRGLDDAINTVCGWGRGVYL